MHPKDFLRIPSGKESEKYEYDRSPGIVVSITAAIGICVLFLILYAAVRSPVLFSAAGISAGVAIALWFVSKGPNDEAP